MNKSDLKSGMVVEFRCGNTKMYIETYRENIFISTYGVSNISEYTEELRHINSPEYDIIKIYEPKELKGMTFMLNSDNLDLIWEYNEKSKEEIEYENMQKELDRLKAEMENFKNTYLNK